MNPLTSLTPASIVIMSLAFLLAFATNAYNSGKIFNLVTVPQPWLPYVGVGLPFLGAIYESLSSTGNLSGLAVVNALFSGLFALLSSGTGAITHNALSAHFELPKRTLAARAAKTAMKIAGAVLLLVGCGGSIPAPPPNLPPDVLGEVNCVSRDVLINGVTDVGQIAKDCTNGELAIAADLVTWLLEFNTVRAQLSTDAIATLLTNAKAAKITAAQSAK